MATTILTLQAGTDRFCSIYSTPAKANLERTKSFMRFDIPEALRGISAELAPTAAVLSIYTVTAGANATAFEMLATYAAWNGASTYAQLDALSTTNYDTFETKAPNGAGQWTNWDVLGSYHASSVGILKACRAGELDITFLLNHPGTPTARSEELVIGGAGGSTGQDYRSFDFPGRGDDGTHVPYLTITHPDAGTPPIVHSGLAGGALMF